MKQIVPCIAFALAAAGAAHAEKRIESYCGTDHVNEVVSAGDVTSNPDGYYIRSLQTQLSHGDPRIVQAVGKSFHLCTRSAARPDMDTNRVLQLMGEREVRYLFVPTPCPKGKPSS